MGNEAFRNVPALGAAQTTGGKHYRRQRLRSPKLIIRIGDYYARSSQYRNSQRAYADHPWRLVIDYFALSETERTHADELMRVLKPEIEQAEPEVVGFNIGVNCGDAAGQTVSHVHLYLIPRRHRDTQNPRGGVRGVTPDKMEY